MAATSFGELSQFSSENLLINSRRAFGASIRTRRLDVGSGGIFDFPDRLHLLYVALNGSPKFTVRHLAIDQVNLGNVGVMERTLFLEAKSNVENGTAAPHLKSSNFDPILFERPAVFTIVIDEQDWEFYFPAHLKPDEVIPNETHDPVVFIERKSVVESSDDFGNNMNVNVQTFEENWAFFDATKITVVGPPTRHAVRLFNFFTDKIGNVLEANTPFGFEIYLRAPSAGTEHRTTIIIDPDGQNQGPPH